MTFALNTTRYSRWLAPFLALLVVFQLTACGDKEPEQRKAFIDYLQNTVMRSGMKLPTLSEDQKQKFGPYVSDYAILVTFSQQLSKSVDASLSPAIAQINEIRVAQDYLNKRDALQQSAGALNLLVQQIRTAKTQADAAVAALKQPDDLKVVFNKAFDSIVTQPTNVLIPAVPVVSAFVQDLAQVGDFLQQQGTQVTFNNGGVQFQTAQQVAQYNAMMANLVAKYPAMMAAQKSVMSVIQ
ncbi:TPA: DUF3053 domain-containing protein [Yersinia enterocolitica]|uniref:DUF3053 domain-containing protein n=1 Tax=Yersinia enterocolitica TaxID=630 RepID=UPI001C66708B|nr:DUF3053 domain-containing protein [Yersinia enterocolitica]MBW5834126.1 DUF3053 domain-containing protein [Yersinia enterocolitica]MBX9474960.1 DUF3053 domain-containing protein [Yersinia enterocolitica]MBX9487101.1 DUF3053 domain-containing protein [Yersinia enterocolitica]MBX9492453.1 DUF3053 domain-containing protein [Yersinia enterocolitica]HEN3642792.1 DUF3053 domain-containing protein [Yersinia enterocolitica]